MPDPAAQFEALYRDHIAFVWTAVRAFGVPGPAIEDAVQDVFLTAYRKLDALRPQVSPRPWLYGVTRRVAFRYRRSAARTARRRSAVASAHTPQREPDNDAGRWLQRFLAELDGDQRDSFVMAELLGMSGPEIAEAQRVPLNTAYSRLRLARRRLSELARAPDHAKRMLAADRRSTPSATARKRMWTAIAPALPSAGASLASTGVAAGLGGLAAALVLLGVAAAQQPAASKPTATPAPGPAHAMRPAASAAVAPPSAAVARTPETQATVDTTVPDRVVALRPRTASAKISSQRRPTRNPAGAPPPVPGDATGASPGAPPPPGAARRLSAGPALAAELRLMDEAKQALGAGDPARALARVHDHARDFRGGQLADVREATRVKALRALGRTAAADEALRTLRCTHPDSNVVRALPGGGAACR